MFFSLFITVMFVSSSSTEMFSGKSKKFCQSKESTAQSSGNQGFHDVPTAAVVCTCVCVCEVFCVPVCPGASLPGSAQGATQRLQQHDGLH